MRWQALRRSAYALLVAGMFSGVLAGETPPSKADLPPEWQFVRHFAEEPFLTAFLELNGPYGHAFLDGTTALGKTGTALRIQGALWHGTTAENVLRRAVLYGEVARGLEEQVFVHLNQLASSFGVVETKPQTGVQEARVGGEAVLAYSVKDGKVALGTPKEFVALPQAKPPLNSSSTPPWLDPLIPHLGQPTQDGLTLRSVFDLTRLPAGVLPGGAWAEAARALGLDGIELRGAAALTVDLKRLESVVAAPHQGELRGLAAACFPTPAVLKLDERLPEETVLLVHYPAPLTHGIAALGALERALDVEAGEEFEREMTDLDRDLGFGFQHDLLALFPKGGVFALCFPPAATVTPTKEGAPTARPGWLALLPCDKPQVAAELFGRWLKFAGITPEHKVVRGVETWDLGEQCLWGCAYAFVDGILYVSESPQTIGLAVEAHKTGRTLSSTRSFRDFRKARPDWGLSLFFSGALVARWARAMMALWPPVRAEDKAVLREAEQRLAVLERLGQVRMDTGNRDGQAMARLEWIGENPLHDLAKACERLLPILTRARRESQRSSSISSAGSLGRCLLMYADDHKDRLPDSMEQLIEEYVKDPGLFRSPKLHLPPPADAKAAARESSYAICFPGRMLGELERDLVLLYEKPWFDDEGTVVCYVNGYAEYVRVDRLMELLEKVRAAGGKP